MKTQSRNTVLWCAAAAFAVLFAAWTTLFVLAAQNKVPTVPVAPRSIG